MFFKHLTGMIAEKRNKPSFALLKVALIYLRAHRGKSNEKERISDENISKDIREFIRVVDL